MNMFLATFSFSFGITSPIFIMLLLGIWLKHMRLLTDEFISVGSALVFKVALPILLFLKISQTPLSQSTNPTLLIYALIATLIVWIILELLAIQWVNPSQERGIVVQGAFRANLGIIGLAYVSNAYGDAGLVAASLYLGLVTILYNILSVITLSYWFNSNKNPWSVAKQIASNPLIIGIVAALPFSWLEIKLPHFLTQIGEYFSQLTLPLALLCTGGSLSLAALRSDIGKTLLSSAGKLCLVPLLITVGGIWYGFRGMELGILFLMCSAPTAASSYIMVKVMGGNATLAANIIALTTLGSALSTSIGIILLKQWQWL